MSDDMLRDSETGNVNHLFLGMDVPMHAYKEKFWLLNKYNQAEVPSVP